MISLTSEVIVLVACIRLYLGTITLIEVTSLLTPNLHWETLLKEAIAYSVMPILYQSLKKIETNHIPPSVMLQLRTLNRMNGLNNLSQTKELLRVLGQLKKSGIEAIAFKGPILAASVYSSGTLRQYNDLDIMVHRQDFWRAKAILIDLGYQSSSSPEIEVAMFDFHLQISLSLDSPESKMFNQQFQPSLLHSNRERSIDLHWGIPPRRICHTERFKQLWQNLQIVMLMEQPIKTFSPEATLVIQCLNVSKEIVRKRSFKQVCDVAQIIQFHPNLNWLLALEIARNLRAQKLFLVGLGVTHDLLHIPLPEFILSKLVRSEITDKKTFGGDRRTSENFAQTLWSEYTYQLRNLDGWIDILFVTIFYLRFLFLNLLPNNLESQLFPLPQKLSFLYYILRPFRLLLKYSPFGKLIPTSNSKQSTEK